MTALLLFAQYRCGQQTYGVKLLGTAKRMPGKAPRAGQVGEVQVPPSSGAVQQPAAAVATTTVHTAGKWSLAHRRHCHCMRPPLLSTKVVHDNDS